MQIRAPEAPREARRLRRPPLEGGASIFCRFRAAEKAVRPVGRAGTASSRAGFEARADFDQIIKRRNRVREPWGPEGWGLQLEISSPWPIQGPG
eukprot:12793114-Alexandrium_andersonii.AAC.1